MGFIRTSSVVLSRVLLLAACCLLFSRSVNAGGNYGDFTISELEFSKGANGVHIVFSGGAWSGPANPDGCDVTTKFIVPYGSTEIDKTMVAGVLTAFATGKPASVFVNGCTSGIGGSTYPSVWYFFAK